MNALTSWRCLQPSLIKDHKYKVKHRCHLHALGKLGGPRCWPGDLVCRGRKSVVVVQHWRSGTGHHSWLWRFPVRGDDQKCLWGCRWSLCNLLQRGRQGGSFGRGHAQVSKGPRPASMSHKGNWHPVWTPVPGPHSCEQANIS